MRVEHVLTSGNFDTEDAAWDEFDARAEKSGCFRIHKQVWGYYLQPRMFSEVKRPRIDRILVPTKKLLAHGWQHGPIGVEGKKSDTKANRAFAQVLDYARAVWEMPNGYNIVLDWIFMFPLQRQTDFVGSIMQQNRIGWVECRGSGGLLFGADATTAIRVSDDGTAYAAERLPSGRKAGSR